MQRRGLIAVVCLFALAIIPLVYATGEGDISTYCEQSLSGDACEAYAASGFVVNPMNFGAGEAARCQDFETCCASDAMWAKVDVLIRIAELNKQYDDCTENCAGSGTSGCYDICETYYEQADALEESTVGNNAWIGMDSLCVYSILTANCCEKEFSEYASDCSAAMGRSLKPCRRGETAGSLCGNGRCEAGEDPQTCPRDCWQQPEIEDCTNRADDDLDGLVDCADSDCASYDYCIQATMTMTVTPETLNLEAEKATEFVVEFRVVKKDGTPLEGVHIGLTIDDPNSLASQWGTLTDSINTDASGYARYTVRLKPLKDALSAITYPTHVTVTARGSHFGMAWESTQTKTVTISSTGFPPKIVFLDYWPASGESIQRDDEYPTAVFADKRYAISVGVDDKDQGARNFKYKILVCDGTVSYQGATADGLLNLETPFSELMLDWKTQRGVNPQDLEFLRTLWEQSKAAAKSGTVSVGASTLGAMAEGTIVGIPAGRLIKGAADAKGVYDGVRSTIEEGKSAVSNVGRGHYLAAFMRSINANLEGAQTTVGAVSIVAKNVLPPIIKNAGDYTTDFGNFVFDITQGGVSAVAAKLEAWDLEKKALDCPITVRVDDADGNYDIRHLLPYYIYWE